MNAAVQEAGQSCPDVLLPAIRHSCPRAMVFREPLQGGLFCSVVPKLPFERLCKGAIDELLAIVLSSSRRYYSRYFFRSVVAQYFDGICSVIYMQDRAREELIVEAARIGDFIAIRGQLFHFAELSDSGTWSGLVWRRGSSCFSINNGWATFTMSGRTVEVPLSFVLESQVVNRLDGGGAPVSE